MQPRPLADCCARPPRPKLYPLAFRLSPMSAASPKHPADIPNIPPHPTVATAAGKSSPAPESECTCGRLQTVTLRHTRPKSRPLHSFVFPSCPPIPRRSCGTRPSSVSLPNPSPRRKVNAAAAACGLLRFRTRGLSCVSLRSSVFPSCPLPPRNVLPTHRSIPMPLPLSDPSSHRKVNTPVATCSSLRFGPRGRSCAPYAFRLSLMPADSPNIPPRRKAKSASATCNSLRFGTRGQSCVPCQYRRKTILRTGTRNHLRPLTVRYARNPRPNLLPLRLFLFLVCPPPPRTASRRTHMPPENPSPHRKLNVAAPPCGLFRFGTCGQSCVSALFRLFLAPADSSNSLPPHLPAAESFSASESECACGRLQSVAPTHAGEVVSPCAHPSFPRARRLSETSCRCTRPSPVPPENPSSYRKVNVATTACTLSRRHTRPELRPPASSVFPSCPSPPRNTLPSIRPAARCCGCRILLRTGTRNQPRQLAYHRARPPRPNLRPPASSVFPSCLPPRRKSGAGGCTEIVSFGMTRVIKYSILASYG